MLMIIIVTVGVLGARFMKGAKGKGQGDGKSMATLSVSAREGYG
jgi:hypothetical protein